MLAGLSDSLILRFIFSIYFSKFVFYFYSTLMLECVVFV